MSDKIKYDCGCGRPPCPPIPASPRQDAETLKSCPFCLNENKDYAHEFEFDSRCNFYAVKCGFCGAQGSFHEARMAAIKAWNTRVKSEIDPEIKATINKNFTKLLA